MIRQVDSSWNFINKIWNAARYVQMQVGDEMPQLQLDKLSSEVINGFYRVLMKS